jgi:hypothetical protein
MNYHHGKANVVADALSGRSRVSRLVIDSMPFELCEELTSSTLGLLLIRKPRKWKLVQI